MKILTYLEDLNVLNGEFDIVEIGAERRGSANLYNFFTRIHLHSGHWNGACLERVYFFQIFNHCVTTQYPKKVSSYPNQHYNTPPAPFARDNCTLGRLLSLQQYRGEFGSWYWKVLNIRRELSVIERSTWSRHAHFCTRRVPAQWVTTSKERMEIIEPKWERES